MWDAGSRYLEIVWSHWINVEDTWTFSLRSPRTCLEVQILFFLCSGRSLRTGVRLCIWLPHLRTGRCVILIWIFSCKSLSTFYKIQTGCFEYPRDVRCTQTLRCWRAYRSLRNQVQRRLRGWNLSSHVWLSVCRQVSLWLSYIFGFVGVVWWGMKILQLLTPKDQEREFHPRVDLHQERKSAEVCFLHIQLIGTNVWLPDIHRIPPEVDSESSRSPAQSESWNSPSVHCCAV